MDTDIFQNTAKNQKQDTREKKYACTVVNMLPYELNEDKPHMLPSTFRVPAAEKGKFGILHVEEGIHYIPNPLIDEGKPGSSIKQITMPDEMARSIVEDFASAQVCLGENAMPGIFWVPGRCSLKTVMENHAETIEKYATFQKNWFHALCSQADADWQKNKNMLAVSDLQRMAAKELGVQADWVELRMQENSTCPFCTVPIPVNAVKCPNCKEIVDLKRYKELTNV